MNNLFLFETDYYKVFLNEDDQYYLGRSIALLKRNAKTLSEVTPQEWVDLGLVVRLFENAATKAFNVTNFNWSATMNSAYLNNPPNPQVYWHVRPRYRLPVKFHNRIFKDNIFGSNFQVRTKLKLSTPFNEEICRHIIMNI